MPWVYRENGPRTGVECELLSPESAGKRKGRVEGVERWRSTESRIPKGMSYRKENQVQVTRIFWTMRRLWLP